MKTAPLILLLVLSLRGISSASGAPEIVIATAETGISYRLVDHNRRSEKVVATLDEVGAWSTDRIKEDAGELVFIYLDDRTSFKTVLDLVRRLKTAGVKAFSLGLAGSEEAPVAFQLFQRN